MGIEQTSQYPKVYEPNHRQEKKECEEICISPAGSPREVCALSGLDERPSILPAENVPCVPIVRVVGDVGALLRGKGVVVVVHDHTEILVMDDTRTAGSKYLAVTGEEHGAAGFLAGLSVCINLEDKC